MTSIPNWASASVIHMGGLILNTCSTEIGIKKLMSQEERVH